MNSIMLLCYGTWSKQLIFDEQSFPILRRDKTGWVWDSFSSSVMSWSSYWNSFIAASVLSSSFVTTALVSCLLVNEFLRRRSYELVVLSARCFYFHWFFSGFPLVITRHLSQHLAVTTAESKTLLSRVFQSFPIISFWKIIASVHFSCSSRWSCSLASLGAHLTFLLRTNRKLSKYFDMIIRSCIVTCLHAICAVQLLPHCILHLIFTSPWMFASIMVIQSWTFLTSLVILQKYA